MTGAISMGATGAGKIDGATKTLSLTGAGSVFTWSSGEIASKVTLGKNGTNPTLNISGAVTLSSTNFDSFATTTWTGIGDLTMSIGSKFTNEVGATFDVRNNQRIVVPMGVGGAIFSNAQGTFKKSAGAGTTEIQCSFASSGPLLAGAGNIDFTLVFTQGAGGVVTLAGGSLQFSGSLNNAGGVLTGSGTITGSVSNSGRVIPGTGGAPGTITIVGGNYTQTAAGELVINVSAAGGIGLLDVQVANGFGGNVNITGTLTVNRNAGYTPPLGTVLTFLTYVTDTGGDFTTKTFNNNAWNNGGARSFSKTANGTADQLTVI